jgi:hypothetical protein
MRLLIGLAAAAVVLAVPAQAGNRLRPVPILMHHVLSAPPANPPCPELYVRPADFAAATA